MGEHLGVDLSGVRVHTDSESHAVSRSLQATAFTQGSDIYFGEGAFDPGSISGQHVLAHELAHVAQQARSSTTPSIAVVGRADDPAETEAERTATELVAAQRHADPAHPVGSLRRSLGDSGHLDHLRLQSQLIEKRPIVATGSGSRTLRFRRLRNGGAIPAVPLQPTGGTVTGGPIRRVVWWEDASGGPVISKITLDRIGSTGGGAHTTAYQLFIETAQNSVINATYPVAIDRLGALAKDVKDLPGWEDTKAQKKLWDEFENTYEHAHAEKTKSKHNANHGAFVETLASDYFKLRNSCEYNYHTDGEGASGSAGEPTSLKGASKAHTKCDWNTITADMANPSPDEKAAKNRTAFDAFLTAAAGLLDTRVMKRPTKKSEVTEWVNRWVNIVRQHIATIIVAHPGVEVAAGLIIDELAPKLGFYVGLTPAEVAMVTSAMNKPSKPPHPNEAKPDQGWSKIEALG